MSVLIQMPWASYSHAQYRPIAPDPFEQIDSETDAEQEDYEPPPVTAAKREAASELPSYIALASNINDFGMFADGGPDSNWFIGFNNAWIVKLPPAPRGQFGRAFIGAKLGRAKTTPNPERPWEHTVVPGKIYMAVSQRPAFVSEQSFFLAETQDIPVETDPGINLSGTGRSEWFWTEVPLHHISSEQSNYLVIWSPTREFRSASTSPILAAKKPAAPAQSPRAWNNNSIMGVPPRMEGDSLKVPIVLQPALAIKLVPNYKKKPVIGDFTVVDADGDQVVARFSVNAKDVDLSWIEMSQDELEWERFSSYRRSSPHLFTLSRASLPPRGAYIRARARDIYGNEGEGATAFIMGKGSQ